MVLLVLGAASMGGAVGAWGSINAFSLISGSNKIALQGAPGLQAQLARGKLVAGWGAAH